MHGWKWSRWTTVPVVTFLASGATRFDRWIRRPRHEAADIHALHVLVAASACVTLAGCTLRPEILSATTRTESDVRVVDVSVRAADAERIRRREIYFSIVVADCDERASEYPAEPFTDGRRASDFAFVVRGSEFAFSGELPERVYAKYQKPCVFLRGGSHFGGKLISQPKRIAEDLLGH